MDSLLQDALLIVLKAQRDPEWAHWNQQIVSPALAVVNARTEDAIQRVVQAMRG